MHTDAQVWYWCTGIDEQVFTLMYWRSGIIILVLKSVFCLQLGAGTSDLILVNGIVYKNNIISIYQPQKKMMENYVF